MERRSLRLKLYKLLFKVGPPSMFGLPQEGMVVVNGTSGGSFVGPTLDSRSGQFVSYGSLSQYRRDDEAVSLSGAVGGGTLIVRDNFFELRVTAEDRREALREGCGLFEQFLRLLGADYGNAFSYEILQIESDSGELEVRPGPRSAELIRATAYNTALLNQHIQGAAASTRLDDERLTKALMYREHAAFLFELRTRVGLFSPHFAFLLTSAYLNMWKAITAILGDPKKDSDHQKRFRTFGLPDNFWKEEVVPLMKVRHDYDVAHYSLDDGAIKQVEQSFGRAGHVCRTVIKAYVRHLGTQASEAKTMEDRFLYFGYGSNMLTKRLRAADRAPSAAPHGRGYVSGRRLTFHKVSNDGSGKCDMQITGDTKDRVEGVLFWIDRAHKPGLDEAEGLNRGYAEAIVDVVTEDGTQKALAYVATNTDPGRVPYDWYKALVVAGALEQALPAAYIDGIRAVASQRDPKPDRRTKREAEAALEGTDMPSA